MFFSILLEYQNNITDQESDLLAAFTILSCIMLTTFIYYSTLYSQDQQTKQSQQLANNHYQRQNMINNSQSFVQQQNQLYSNNNINNPPTNQQFQQQRENEQQFSQIKVDQPKQHVDEQQQKIPTTALHNNQPSNRPKLSKPPSFSGNGNLMRQGK